MAHSESSGDDDDDSGSGSDWEEVVEDEYHYLMARLENPAGQAGNTGNETKTEEERQRENLSSIPENGLQITIPSASGLGRRGKKKTEIIGNYIIREINKCTKEVQLDLHRVSLLCLLSRGLQYNKVLSSEVILGVSLSTLPSERSYPPKNVDLNYFEKFLKWFRSHFKVVSSEIVDDPAPINVEQLLITHLSDRKVTSHQLLVFMFITILRALGVQVRLVWNFIPLPLKPNSAELMKLLTDDSDKPDKPGSSTQKAKEKPTSSKASSAAKQKPSKRQKAEQSSSSSENSDVDSDSEVETKQPKSGVRRSSRKPTPLNKKDVKPSTSKKAGPGPPIKGGKKAPDSDTGLDDPEFVPVKKRSSAKPSTPKKAAPSSKRGKKVPDSDPGSDESEFVSVKKRRTAKTNKETPSKKSRSSVPSKNTGPKFISSSDEETKSSATTKSPVTAKSKPKYDYWAEVYLEEEERWVSVDLLDGKILCDSTLEAKATHPVCYVMSFGNTGNVKDVTRRYASQWLTNTQKGRDGDWWMTSVRPFRGRRTERDRTEDEFLDQHLRSLPLPKSIQEFKGHPMFVLRRHLLKFEAIYPANCDPCGFIKDEAVYPRSSVHTLNARETWVRKAKVVRLGEKPYKVVKARPKYDRMTGSSMGDRPLDLFGEWQVEEYQCPIAKDGKVPRNEYGNVELYMEKMLPIGTVHLRAPGLNRVARKLDIDCANAMVGFDFHAGGSHPTFDGFVVCEEHKEILLDAWNQEQDEMKKKDEAKRLLAIYKNWERLCRGLLIRQRLETQYSYNLSGKRKNNIPNGDGDDASTKRKK